MGGEQTERIGTPEARATASSAPLAASSTSASTASALVAGTAVATVLLGVGAWALAASSYPLAFGLDLRGDRPYPFPWPEGVAVGLVLTMLGAGCAVAVVTVAGQHRTALRIGVALLCVVIAASAVTSVAASSERRCAARSYDASIHCTSRGRSAARDFGAIAVPAGLALVGLQVTRRRTPKHHERTQPDATRRSSTRPERVTEADMGAKRRAKRVALVLATPVIVVAGAILATGASSPFASGEEPPSLSDTLRPENAALLLLDERPDPVVTDTPDGSLGKDPDLEVGKVTATLEAVLPGSDVGTMWITASKPERLVVETTATGPSLRKLQRAAEGILPGQIIVEHGNHSLAQLDGFRDHIVSSMAQSLDVTFGAGIAVRSNHFEADGQGVVRFSIGADQVDDELIDRLAALVPRDALEIDAQARQEQP